MLKEPLGSVKGVLEVLFCAVLFQIDRYTTDFQQKLLKFIFFFIFLHRLHAESGVKATGKDFKKAFLRCLRDTIYGKGVYHALCS